MTSLVRFWLIRNPWSKYVSMAWRLPFWVAFPNGKGFRSLLSLFRNFICVCLLICLLFFATLYIYIYDLCFIIKWSPTFILRICPFLSVDTVSYLFLPIKVVCLLRLQKWHLENAARLFLKQIKVSGFILKFIHPKFVRYQT